MAKDLINYIKIILKKKRRKRGEGPKMRREQYEGQLGGPVRLAPLSRLL